MTNAQTDKQIAHRLSDLGVRYTAGRRAVVTGLANSEGPMTVAELQATLSTPIPLSSLYRSLSVMSEAGIVSPHHSGHGVTRYELAEWLTGHHHHLVCVSCGSVNDIEISSDHEQRLKELVSTLAAGSDFAASDHSLEIDGECRECRR